MVIVHGHVSLTEGIRFHWGWFETKAIDFNHFSLPVPLAIPYPLSHFSLHLRLLIEEQYLYSGNSTTCAITLNICLGPRWQIHPDVW